MSKTASEDLADECECGEVTERPGRSRYWYFTCSCGRKIFAWIEDDTAGYMGTELDPGGRFVELPESLDDHPFNGLAEKARFRKEGNQ